MKRLATVLEFRNWRLTSKLDDLSVPMVEKQGHVYVEWTIDVLFTTPELRRVHRHFIHPEPHRLYAMMKRGAPEKLRPEYLTALEEITRSCDVCQRQTNAPHRFRVSMPHGECTFNRLVSLDLMSLEKCTALHVVDVDTKFGAACFLPNEGTKESLVRTYGNQDMGEPLPRIS